MGTYSSLAHLMASYPELMILRKFSRLNAKNLLYYEAELATLEHELEAIEIEDRHCEELPRQDYATSWATMVASGEGPTMAASGDAANDSTTIGGEQVMDERDKLQWQKFLKIRERLCKYNEALIQQMQLKSMAEPTAKNLDCLRDWLDRDGYGNRFLLGTTEGVWDKENSFNDFSTLHSTSDGISESLAAFLLRCKRHLTSANQPQYHVYSLEDSSRIRVANGVVTVVSSVLPVLPLVVLFWIHDLIVRIGLILVFTVVFATLLVFGMHMDSDKVLAVTTAFAAIQVAIVGGTVPSTTS